MQYSIIICMGKDRTWTKLLQAAGSRAVNHPKFEVSLTRRKLIAEMVLSGIVDGKIFFLDGREEQIGSNEWIGLVKWLYNHIDGPAPQQVQVSTPEGESLRIEDVTTLTTAERLARLNALYVTAAAERARQSSDNGQTHTNGFHGASLEDSGT